MKVDREGRAAKFGSTNQHLHRPPPNNNAAPATHIFGPSVNFAGQPTPQICDRTHTDFGGGRLMRFNQMHNGFQCSRNGDNLGENYATQI